MPAFVLNGSLVVPAWVVDHTSYRRWATSDEFPERGRFAFIDGRVWVDLEMERRLHNLIKMMVGAVLTGHAGRNDLGTYFGDGMLVSNVAVGLSTEPDGMFVSWASYDSGAVTEVGGEPEDGVEVLGTPDMVLEVVSPSSVRKDTKVLFEAYWQAGVAEYWLIDPRGEHVEFTLYAWQPQGYRAVKPASGWRKSAVFGAAFRLTAGTNRRGQATYALEIR